MGIVGNVIIMKLKVVSDKFEISILLVNFYLKFFFYNYLYIVIRLVILVDRSGGDEDMIYLI